jgi:serine/threonine protein kinase
MFKKNIPKLIDFGMGKYKANTNTFYKGSPIYMSP